MNNLSFYVLSRSFLLSLIAKVIRWIFILQCLSNSQSLSTPSSLSFFKGVLVIPFVFASNPSLKSKLDELIQAKMVAIDIPIRREILH